MSAIARLIKGGAWLALANLVSKLATTLALPLLARLLGPEALGIYSIIFSLTQSAQGFSSLGADIAMHRNGAQYQTIGTEAVGRLFGVGLALILLVSAATGFGVWFFRDPLAQYWLGKSDIAPWLGAAALLIAIQPLGNIPLLFLASLQDFRAYALRSSVGIIVSSTATVFLAWRIGLTGAVLGLILAAIIQILWSYLIVKNVLHIHGISLRLDRFWQQSVAILKFGLPYYFGNTLLSSLFGVPLMGLVSHYGGLEQLGYLRVAQSMAALIGFIPTAIAPAAISYLSASSQDEQQSYQNLKSVHLRSIWILLLLPTGAVCFLLPQLIELLFGPAYQQATFLAWLYLWISLMAGVSAVLVQYLVVAGETVRVAWASTIGAISGILVTLILVPQLNGLGFIIGQFFGQLIAMPVIASPVFGDLKREEFYLLKSLFFLTIIMIVSTGATSLFTSYSLLMPYLTFFITAIASYWTFSKIIKESEKNTLKKIVNTALGRIKI